MRRPSTACLTLPETPNGYTMANELPTSLIHLIPSYLRRDVSQLLTSQGRFLSGRKRSSADLTVLKELYSQLEQYWEELTWQNKTKHINALREKAKSLQRDLKKTDETVTSDLEKMYESEFRNAESHLRIATAQLQSEEKKWQDNSIPYQQRKSDWQNRLATEKSNLHASYLTWKAEHSALAEKWADDVAALESKLQELSDVLQAFESNTPPESEQPWTERRNFLASKRSDLEQRKKNLQEKKQDLAQRKQRLAEVREEEFQTSQKLSAKQSSLKDITRSCRTLKAELIAQGKLTVDDYPDIPLPFIT